MISGIIALYLMIIPVIFQQITAIAIASLFYVYLNQHLIMQASDSTLSMGIISLQ